MFQENKSLLEWARSLSEETKHIIIVSGTVLVAGVVFFVWLTFFNPLSPSTDSIVADQNEPGSFSFMGSVGAGGGALKQGMANIWNSFKGLWTTQKDYLVKPDQQ
ncbi:MAG TPA: hypothetical protein VMC43_02060 [Candidatus Paceibacterota bacterium]|nr:hypothetical protein [Candidatus Paceibacterota bacterium]